MLTFAMAHPYLTAVVTVITVLAVCFTVLVCTAMVMRRKTNGK